jgi:galactokinase
LSEWPVSSEMDLISQFENKFKITPSFLSRAPGRVNLLGEHVDYNAGPVLPAAIDRYVRLAIAANPDGIARLHALDLNQQVAFRLQSLERKVDLAGKPLPGWALYPSGVAWALQQAGLETPGLDAVYNSNVPIGSGLSSSAAVEVGFAVSWEALGGWQLERMSLARLCQRAENEFVGVSSGLMDQFASAHGVEGHALYFDTRSLEWESIPMPQGTALVVADSGVRRSLATSAYNERRAACEQGLAILRRHLPGITSLRDVSPTEFAAYSEFLPPVVRRRVEHVVKEIARVHSAVVALRLDERAAFGAIMISGHASLRDLFEVSTPELDALVEIAGELPGCYGARLTGAGFGGCTINLVEESLAQEFSRELEEEYRRRTGRQAQVYLCRASAGAAVEALGR